MPQRNDAGLSIAHLIASLIRDVRTLVRQQVALARAEMHETFRQALTPAILLGTAVSMLAVGGLWILIAVTRAFTDLFGLPVWSGYAVIGLILAIAGALLLAVTQHQVRTIRILPRTRKTLSQDALRLTKVQHADAVRQG